LHGQKEILSGILYFLTLLKENNVNYNNLIERNPEILQGKPIIKGTRISVELIVRKLAGGFSIPEILENYPHLSENQIKAALEYTADLIANEDVLELA